MYFEGFTKLNLIAFVICILLLVGTAGAGYYPYPVNFLLLFGVLAASVFSALYYHSVDMDWFSVLFFSTSLISSLVILSTYL